MSSLFKNLYYLLRTGQNNIFEDYLTEIVAEIFEDSDMQKKFFKKFAAITLKEPSNIQVSTQKKYFKLIGHETDSIPDLVIQFYDGGKPFIAFFESKLEASEGYLQLQRYAEHLKVYENKGYETFLFYVTRYHDPKERDDIIQLRWYMIYNWLKDNRNIFVDKIIAFMEEIKLNETRRFLPQDVFAIQQMSRLQKMMDEIIDGPVDDTMARLFGKTIGWSNRMVQLRDSQRYFKACIQDDNWSTWIGYGIQLTVDDYPMVSVILEVSPTCSKRKEIMQAIEWFLNSNDIQKDWKGYNLGNESKWSGISCDRCLLDFLKSEDHISTIQEYLIAKIEELGLLKKQYPNLNWKI